MTRHQPHPLSSGRLALAVIATALFMMADAPAAPPPANAAGIVVTTLIDFPIPVVDGECSLREAIINANADATVVPDCAAGVGADTITFSVNGAINLSTQLHPVTSPAGLVIDGTGRDIRLHGGGFGAQFNVAAGAVAEVRGLTFEDNPAGVDTDREGGGINNAGTLTLDRVTVRNNVADYGGGIFSTGTLTLQSSTVSGNLSLPSGGGIWSSGTLIVRLSTISGNTGKNGAGIANQGVAAMVNSTVSGNVASAGLENQPAVPGDVGSGGGIANFSAGSFVIANSTITNNRVGYCPSICSSGAAGIRNSNPTGLALINSVVAGNVAVGAGDWDCGNNIEIIGPNLIGNLFQCTTFGTAPITGDAYLGPLANNGGPTRTHALLAPSPAIGTGDPARCAAPPVSGVDQRGVVRPQGAVCDLGAFESELPGSLPGGRNLKITTGSIDLNWDGGIAQTDYLLLRYNTSTSVADLLPLAGNATSYSDVAAADGTVYCYVLATLGPASALLGLSDLLCAMAGQESGTVIPQNFALKLGGTANATMTWTPPVGGVTSYLLQRIPLNGSPITNVVLGSDVTTTTQPVTSAGTCFQLVAFAGVGFGGSDVLCGVPGISTLGAASSARLASVEEAVAAVTEGLAGVMKADAVLGRR